MTQDTSKQAPMTRRAFGAAGLSAAFLAANGATLPLGAARAQEPKRGGRVRVAARTNSTIDILDPGLTTQGFDHLRARMFYNGLTRMDSNGEPQPELAESFEANASATRWVFKLRKGVTFHDGKRLDAQDVIYSIMRQKGIKKFGGSVLIEGFASMKADGNDTVVIGLAAPDADIPSILAVSNFMVVKDGTTDFSTAIGTGGFTVKEFRPGIRTVGARSPSYFKEGRPYVDEIELFAISDSAARLNALLAGDVQIIQDLPPALVADVKSRPGFEVFATNSPQFVQLAMLTDQPPFDNQNLRLAVKYLLDRERMVKSLMNGQGVVANDHPVMPQSELFNKDQAKHALDPEKAKFYLSKAGLINSKIELNVSEAAIYSMEMGLLLQNEAKKIGLDVELRRWPSDTYWSSVYRKRAFCGVQWNPRPTYNMTLAYIWKSDAYWNDTNFKSEKLDALINDARTTLDLPKRKAIYADIEQLIAEEGGNLIPAFVNYIDAHSSNVKGLVPVPFGSLSYFSYSDMIWLDS